MATQCQSVEIRALPDALSEAVAPWEKSPYQLITWWEMDQFSAAAIYWSGQMMEKIKTDCLLRPTRGDQQFYASLIYGPLDDETFRLAIDTFTKVEGELNRIGLQLSAETLRHEILDRLDEKSERLSFSWLMQQISSLQRLVQREMSKRLFLFISPDKAKFWPKQKEPHPFGEHVYKAFPSISFDVHNAGCALSAGFATASVFHLMRVLEIVLGVLGTKFGVSLAHTNWAPVIEQIESRIRDLHKDPTWKVLPDCKEQQEFYSQAASHFGILKDAWRNYTMHARGKYTEMEAEHIYNSVKAFTQKLAERLSE